MATDSLPNTAQSKTDRSQPSLTITTNIADYDGATLILGGLEGICYTLGETYHCKNSHLSETFFHLANQIQKALELLREEERPEQEAA